MPLVRSIDILPDGIRIVTTRGGTHTLTSADIPAVVKRRSIAEVETFATDWLASRLTPLGMVAAIHITSITPLVCQAMVSNDPIVDGWWL